MGVEASQNRRDQLAKLLDEEIEFLPRERKDIDAVVTFTDGLESKALVPALKFHFADELPVFATSQTARAADLGALAGFQVTELPLLAEPRAIGQNLSAAFKLADSPLVELYALGLDAYRLATWTQWFQQNRAALAADTAVTLEAASGTLTLSREGLIKRALTLAAIDPRGRLQTSSKQPR
jgi:outer membrane PBP1 activator LpoA protein